MAAAAHRRMPAPAGLSLRDSCVVALAKHLHTVRLSEFTAVVWPEDCLLALLQARRLRVRRPLRAPPTPQRRRRRPLR